MYDSDPPRTGKPPTDLPITMSPDVLARWMIYAGVGLVLLGALVWGVGRFIDIGQLPGDLSYEGERFRIYAPITSMIVLSIILTIVLNLIIRFFQ